MFRHFFLFLFLHFSGRDGGGVGYNIIKNKVRKFSVQVLMFVRGGGVQSPNIFIKLFCFGLDNFQGKVGRMTKIEKELRILVSPK